MGAWVLTFFVPGAPDLTDRVTFTGTPRQRGAYVARTLKAKRARTGLAWSVERASVEVRPVGQCPVQTLEYDAGGAYIRTCAAVLTAPGYCPDHQHLADQA